MRPLLIATEESHILLRLFNGSIQTLDSIKDRIGHIFANTYCGKSNIYLVDKRHDVPLPSALQDFIVTVGNQYQLETKDWFSQNKDYNDKRSSQAVFNALDAMLKGSLDRLKTMRSAFDYL
uniref:Uncharacterized protein n=1 Tax=Davidia involucrata TaxID=16924 RepID=A0A5B6ZMN9_DAVIN